MSTETSLSGTAVSSGPNIYGTSNTIGEVFSPTLGLRILRKHIPVDDMLSQQSDVLQQGFISNLGNTKWVDVPIVEEGA